MISVIVPAYNEETTIGACLEALLNQEGLTVPWEIIVVDDGSTDRTAEIAERVARAAKPRPPIHVISQANQGVSAARNAGADLARGDILLFTDADCRPGPRWAAAIAAGLATSEAAAIMGLQHSDQAALVARFVQAEYDEKQAELLSRDVVTFADTATVGIRADAFRAAGGYNPALRNFEDTDLAFRLADAGHVLGVARDAVVMHEHVSSAGDYTRRKYRIGYWGSAVYRQHLDKVTDDSRTPWSMRAQMVLAPLVVAGLVLAPFGIRWQILFAVAVGGFVAATVPILRHARAYGWDVVLAAPVLLFLRALALTAGLSVGLASRALGRHQLQRADATA